MIPIEFREKCGVGGVMAPRGEDAAPIAVEIGRKQQHRGQEGGGVGIKPFDQELRLHKGNLRFGLIFTSVDVLDAHSLHGEIALSHTRYRTTGSAKDEEYAQPFLVSENGHTLMGVHNGNIANSEELKEGLKARGVEFQTGRRLKDGTPLPVSDSEILFRKIAIAEGDNWPTRIKNGLSGVEGSYSLVMATDNDEMIAVRDPHGIRPLSMGRFNGHWMVASETVALSKIGARDQREIGNGEMVVFRQNNAPEITNYSQGGKKSYCDMEDYYFSWPASVRNNIETNKIREMFGLQMAEDEILSGRLVKADLVTCFPDTGRSAAIPFAEKLGIPYRDRIYKERYDEGGRSFIQSNKKLRENVIDNKFNYSLDLEGKVIYVCDDSGIRLLTTEIGIRALREVGAQEIHMRFMSPKFKRPCVLGVNINGREELGAVEMKNGVWITKSNEQIAAEIGADSVAFLSMEGRANVRRRMGENPEDFCGYCHGDEGPGFDMTKYDPGLLKEPISVEQLMVSVYN